MTKYFVEFLVADERDWICTESLQSIEAAVDLEARFHAIGWKARAFSLQLNERKSFLN